MNTISSHGMFQFDMSKLTPQEIANLGVIAMLGFTDDITCYNIVNTAIRICNQFQNFTIGMLFNEDYTMKVEQIALNYNIAYELLIDYIRYFKLDKDTIKYNEWFSKNFEHLNVEDIFNTPKKETDLGASIKNEDDTEPVKTIREQEEDEINLSDKWFLFVEEMDLSKLEEKD